MALRDSETRTPRRMQNFPGFQQKRADQAPCSTKEYSARFTDSLSLHQNEDVELIQQKQGKNGDLSAKEKQVLKITRGAFLEVLGDHAVRKIKEKNPRKEIYTESITWLKKQREQIWKNADTKVGEFVNLFSLIKDPNMSLKDH